MSKLTKLGLSIFLLCQVVVAQAQSSPSDIGQWGPLKTLPFRPVHSIVLPTGEVMMYSNLNGQPLLWEPSLDTLTPATPFSYNPFCNGHAHTADGRVFFAGGTVDNLNNVGLPHADIYDPITNTFSPVPDMNAGRWYPSLVAMGNGDIVALSGEINVGVRNLIPEVWEQSTGTWRDLSDASLRLPQYPEAFLAPNGNVFVASEPSRYLDISGAGQWTYVANRLVTNRDNYGSACLFDNGMVLYTGGGINPAMASGEVINLNDAVPTWTAISDMPQRRRQHNSTLLPDGRVLVTGGSSADGFNTDDGPKPAIVWDPATDSWTTWAIEDEFRGYHSESVLLPDARIASIGGDGHPSMQVFSPPYLFNGPRPVITSAPTTVSYGETFFVTSPDSASVAAPGGQVNWLRPSAVTHTNNMNQRFNRLAFTEVGGLLEVTAPTDPNISPAGDYMLFLVNSSGVPSVAAWIRLVLQGLVPGLIEGWKFEVDGRSGSGGNDGDLENGAEVIADANRGNVLSCDGVDDFVRVDNQITPAFSWAAWVRSTEQSSTGTAAWEGDALISSMVAGSGDDFVLAVLNDRLSFYSESSGVEQSFTGSTELTVGDWHHVAVTADSNGINLYVDGQLDAVGDGVSSPLSGSPDVRFCGDPTINSFFSGRIDEIEQYDRALSASNVLQLATVGIGTNPLTVDHIVSAPIAVDTPVQYTAQASGGANLQYRWDFGDGTQSGQSGDPIISHQYDLPGLYLVTLTVTSATSETAVENFFQAVHLPKKANRATSSMSIIYEVNAGGDRIWNVNPDNNSVSVFDVASQVVSEIPVGDSPRSLALAPDGRVWVANKRSSTISIINPGSLSVVQTVDMPYASQPHGVVFDPSGSAAYVTLEALGELHKLDPADASLLDSVALGSSVRHLSVTWDSAKVLVSRFVSPKLPGEETGSPQTTDQGGQFLGGEVLIVDAAQMSLANSVVLQHSEANDGAGHEHENGHAAARGIPNYLGGPAISPDGLSAWVPSKQDNIKRGVLRDGLQLTHDTTYRAITSRISLEAPTETEDYAARVDHDNGAVPSASMFGFYGNYLFVALEGSRQIRVIDAYGNNEVNSFSVGRAPQGLAISPDGQTLYTHNFMDRTVSVHDVSEIVLETGPQPELLATYSTVSSEFLLPDVLLGKKIFYDADDPRISRESYISCAGCHNDGGHDGRVWDFTGFGEGLRNTTDLNGKTDHGPVHWTGNFDEIQDFECQLRNLAEGTGFIPSTEVCDELIDSLGTPKAGMSVELDALATYVNSLTETRPSPYRNSDGSLTTAALSGKTIFESNNCANCHTGDRFTDSALDVLHAIEPIRASSGSRLGAPLTGFDTPTLNGLWTTAPYLHDGSASTLADAVTAHESTTIDPADLLLLVAYLEQLDGSDTSPPGVPESLTATAVSPTQIDLSWEASTDDSPVVRYNVYRTDDLVNPVATALTATSYSVTNLAPSTTYSFQVQAEDGSGNQSALSNPPASATTDAAPVELIVDNLDANTSRIATWSSSSGVDPYLGNSVYSGISGVFTWHPGLSVAGDYDVYAWWTYHPNRSDSVSYNIVHDGGTDTVVVDQLDPALGGQWVLLGRYSFTDFVNINGNGDVSVLGASPSASADAVRYVRVE